MEVLATKVCIILNTDYAGPLQLKEFNFSYLFLMVGMQKLKWRQLAHHQLMKQQGPHFSPHSKAKVNYKSINIKKLVNSRISDVATASVHSEKTSLKKLIMIIIMIMNKSQEKTFFHGR